MARCGTMRARVITSRPRSGLRVQQIQNRCAWNSKVYATYSKSSCAYPLVVGPVGRVQIEILSLSQVILLVLPHAVNQSRKPPDFMSLLYMSLKQYVDNLLLLQTRKKVLYRRSPTPPL